MKTGLATTFVDNAAAMIEQTRRKIEEMGEAKVKKATLVVADIVEMTPLPDAAFSLAVAMGDPLSICSDPVRAAREMFRVCKPGGIVIASADNKLAAIDHFIERGNLEALEQFVSSGRTHWLTADPREQFETTTFSPTPLKKMFEKAGFEVLDLIGKTILPVRQNRKLFEFPDAVDRLIRVEAELARDPAAMARAGHLQITVRRPAV